MRFFKKTFRDQQIQLDFNEYRECVFQRCNLSFAGSGPVSLIGNTFHESSWEFTGAAGTALKFLQGLYHGGGHDLVEATFETIRQGKYRGSTTSW